MSRGKEYERVAEIQWVAPLGVRMNVLVTGGAGYIGSHAVKVLIARGHRVVVLDNLSHGHREAVHSAAKFLLGSSGDSELLRDLLPRYAIEAVLHFAADIEVGESVSNPGKYYENNFSNALRLLTALTEAGIKKLVFSSTAAVYGNAEKNPIEETSPRLPINPYGRSKFMTEMAIEDFSRAHGLGFAILRYFNVAGASPDGEIGEAHEPESHLIPCLLEAARDPDGVARVYGADYPTPDGTCIRDYVHVMDLAEAHALALEKIVPAAGRYFNLGSEKGFSVLEVIHACEKTTGLNLKVLREERRPGDPPVLVASNRAAREFLGWVPKYPTLEEIISHAWRWHTEHPRGFK